MAKLYVRKSDGTYVPQQSVLVSNLDIVQGKGDSLTSAMSQKSITDEFATKQDTISDLETIRSNAKNASNTIASMIEAGYVFAGVATPSTNPGTPEAKVFYIANGKGTYTNFGGLEVTENEVVVLYWDTAWSKVATGIASQEKLTELENKVDELDFDLNGGGSSDVDITPTSTTGYYYDISGTNIVIRQNAASHYSGTIVDTSTPPSNGIDISGYVGRTIKVTMSSMSAGSSRKTIIAAQDFSVLDGFLEETYTADSGSYSKSFVVPSGAKWLFWSGVGNLSSIVVIGVGQIGGLVGRVDDLESETETNSASISAIGEKTELLRIVHSANLFNKDDSDVVMGKFLTGNRFYDDANYNVSGYIPVSPSTTYYGATGTQPFRFAEYYAEDKSYLSGANIPNGSQFTTPVNCAFVRVTFYASRYSTAQVAKTDTAYVAYFYFLETGQGTGDDAIATLKDVNGSRRDVLYGKKWVACGDSFTHGDFTNAPEDNYHIEDGLYQGQLKVYPFIIGNRTKMVVVNEAVNGSTMTYVGGNRSEFSTPNGRYTQIPADADYITLKFGINDDTAHASAPIGTIDDNTNTTFYGAWNIVMDYIIRNHPQAKIGIIVTNGSQLPYVNAIIAIAEKWGVSYLNEATDPQCSFMFRSNRADVVAEIKSLRDNHWYVDPNTNNHPNALAHEYESSVVEAWLRTL